VIRDYTPKGVKFYYVYKSLAHPELHGYVRPVSFDERLMHAQEAQRRIPTQAEWLVDGMDNAIKHAFGDAPNSEFIIDDEGVIVRRRGWSRPDELRADLEKLVGPVEEPTRVEDLDVRFEPPEPVAAQGVVERPELPSGLQPIRSEPIANPDGLPFYVKLRAEATSDFFRQGAGRLYLGFHLDPLYGVHWNNEVDPVRFEIEAPEGLDISPRTAEGPQPEEPSDVDPREFVLDLALAGYEVAEQAEAEAETEAEQAEATASQNGEENGTDDESDTNRSEDDGEDEAERERPSRIEIPADLQTFEVAVHYFGCNDEEGFCIPVTQRYRVTLEPDRDGGRAMRGFGFGGSRGRGRGRDGDRPDFAQMFRRFFGGDSDNGDGPTLPEGAERLMGRLVAVDAEAGILTIETRDGEEATRKVAVDEETGFIGRDAPESINELQPGDRVMMILRPAAEDAKGDDATPRAFRIMVRGQRR